MREETRDVKPSPAVQALVAEDDSEAEVKPPTKDEVRAALEAARGNARPATPADLPPVGGSGEWQRLEKEQSERGKAYRAKLESTVVYMGPDGMYHSHDYPKLKVMQESIAASPHDGSCFVLSADCRVSILN